MMKNSYAVNVAVAGVLLVPAIALQSGGAQSLQDALAQTISALESLAQVQTRIEVKDPSATTDLLALTEPPIADARTRDALRDELRDSIQRLQSELDAGAPAGEWIALDAAAPDVPETPTTQAVAFEPHGYVADAARLGRAFFRQGRYAEALAVLGAAQGDAEALYWKARSLEALGKGDEAVAAYKDAVAAAKDERTIARAKEALEFLEWQRRFDARKQKSAEAGKP